MAAFLVALVPRARGDFQSIAVGVRGRDFVVIGADATFRRGLVAMDGRVDKIAQWSDRELLCAIGDAGEADDLGRVLRESLRLHRLRTPGPS